MAKQDKFLEEELSQSEQTNGCLEKMLSATADMLDAMRNEASYWRGKAKEYYKQLYFPEENTPPEAQAERQERNNDPTHTK
jgi:hypothetical protein